MRKDENEIAEEEAIGTENIPEENLNAENEEERKYREYAEKRAKEEYMRRYNRTPLVLALVGFLCSAFFGIGLPVALVAFFISVSRVKKNKSRPLVWAATVSFAAVALSLIYIAAVAAVYVF
ncbi:MAG TPA: hypothetical protein DDW54_04110 [Clostridiales bacterium]|nr:hypothetical protein [Clostridiales bacterium]